MIPKSINDKRKGVFGLILWAIIAFSVSFIYSVSKGDWAAAAGFAGAIAAMASTIWPYETLFRSAIEKLPHLSIYVDGSSRYSLFQLVVKNNGGSNAYNIKLEWLNKHPKTGEDLSIPKNAFGHPVSFSNHEENNKIWVLPPGQTHLTVIDGYHQIFEKYPDKAFFLAKLTYWDSYENGTQLEQILPLSLDEFRSTLNYVEEYTKTNFELQKLPKSLEKINSTLAQIKADLNAGRKASLGNDGD